MDMKKILQNFDSASKKSTKSVEGVHDMKRFVSIISESSNPYKPVEEQTINSFEAGTVGGDANDFLLAADKIQDMVMSQVSKIKIHADEANLRDMMDKFNVFMTAYHNVGKEIIQPDMFTDDIAEISDTTKQSYKDKAEKQVKELEPFTKKGEYKDIAKRMIDRREKGLEKVKKESLSIADYFDLAEAKKDPCWKGYQQIGMKEKGGKQVPNCVPKKKK